MHKEGGGSQQGDAEVYQELARANLLRMRGDYLGAEAECLKILRRFPNNASAHTLLGDIYGEKGDPEQALQWYELSADLVDDGAVAEKISAVQRRISDRDHANTAKELGLPAERSQKALFVFSILVPVIVVFIAAYALGRREGQVQTNSKIHVVPPIHMPGKDQPAESEKGNAEQPNDLSSAGSDMDLLQSIKSYSAEGANVLLCQQDPRTKDLTVTYLVDEGKQIRPMGARVAAAALDRVPDSLSVTVRAMEAGKTVYVANVHRTKLNEIRSNSWQIENRENPNAWIDYVLEFEWSVVPKAHSGGPSAESNPPVGSTQDQSASHAGSEAGKSQTPSTEASTPGSQPNNGTQPPASERPTEGQGVLPPNSATKAPASQGSTSSNG